MKLERFGNDQKLKKTLIIIGIVVLIAAIGYFVLKSYALYKENKTFNVINGKIGDFTSSDITLTYTINGALNSSPFPSKNGGFTANSVTCENGATASWNSTNWGLTNIVSNGATDIKCNVDFSANYVQYVSSTTNSCIYNGSKCTISSTPITVSYKPDGTTAVDFYVLADDGTTLTLVTKNSVGSKNWGSTGKYNYFMVEVNDIVESVTSEWKYTNKLSYELANLYYVDVEYLPGSHGATIPNYKLLIGSSDKSYVRNNVNARVLTMRDVIDFPYEYNDYNSEQTEIVAKYTWLSDFGWLADMADISNTAYPSENLPFDSAGSGYIYGAWYINSKNQILVTNISSTDTVHAVIEIDKSLLAK